MSLKSFIAGDGPYYRITGAAPSAPGQTLLSAGDGGAEWGSVSSAPTGDTSQWSRDVVFFTTGVVDRWRGITPVTSDTGGGPSPYLLNEIMLLDASAP